VFFNYRFRNYLVKRLRARGIYISRDENSTHSSILQFIVENLISQGGAILHVGAHLGQEADFYSSLGVRVLWIEAQPEIFKDLQARVKEMNPKQQAVLALLGDRSDADTKFYLSNNGSLSSSIFKLGKEAPWDGLKMSSVITLNMVRLDQLYAQTDFLDFSHGVIDVQGAELLVLKGFGNILDQFNSLQVEISTMNTYDGGAKYEEIRKFLKSKGFAPLWSPRPGTHQDVIFLRNGITFSMRLRNHKA